MNAPVAQRPLASICMFAYNHERFIVEALEGAVSQTYTPIEILLSDDASTDRTFARAEAFAAGYAGPHALRLHRNDMNLGVAGNVNRTLADARGELLFFADGDDVSLPERVAACWEHYRAHGEPLYLVSDAIWMDEEGREIPGDFRLPARTPSGIVASIRARVPGAWGTGLCFHRRLWDVFGPFRAGRLRLIDCALAFRAALLGGSIAMLPRKLVRYRQHAGGVCSGTSAVSGVPRRVRFVRQLVDYLDLYHQFHLDLHAAWQKRIVNERMYRRAERVIVEESYATMALAHAVDGPWVYRLPRLAGMSIAGLGRTAAMAWRLKRWLLDPRDAGRTEKRNTLR